MHTRRSIIASLAAQLALATDANSANVEVLTKLIALLNSTIDALGKVFTGLKSAASEGFRVLPKSAAEQERDRLIDISKHALSVVETNSAFSYVLEDYISRFLRKRARHDGKPSTDEASEWGKVINALRHTFVNVHLLLEALKTESSTLVLEPAYARLRDALQQRTGILDELERIEPPRTRTELKLLEKASGRYSQLIKKTQAILPELNSAISRTIQR